MVWYIHNDALPTEEISAHMTSAGEKLRGSYTIMHISYEDHAAAIKQLFSVEPTDGNKMFLVAAENFPESNYDITTDINCHMDVLNQLEKVRNGEITKKIKSQPIEADHLTGDVKVMVGENADQIFESIDKSSDDAIIMVHASWCGHCKTFSPILDEFAAATLGKVNAYKIDGADNYVPAELAYTGFPTIYVKKDGQLDLYSGKRTLEDLADFFNVQIVEQQQIDTDL